MLNSPFYVIADTLFHIFLSGHYWPALLDAGRGGWFLDAAPFMPKNAARDGHDCRPLATPTAEF